jgi:hypothetical protein
VPQPAASYLDISSLLRNTALGVPGLRKQALIIAKPLERALIAAGEAFIFSHSPPGKIPLNRIALGPRWPLRDPFSLADCRARERGHTVG